jgi:putative tryptophan/tyrosine transport system substrate-binding protein
VIRRALPALLVVVAVLLGAVGAIPQARAQSAAAWFRYGEEATQSWHFAQAPDDPLRISVRPRFSSVPSRRIMVLYPRPSSAYDIAITKILQVFAEKDIDAAFTVVNFSNEDARGQAAIDLAERDKFDLIFAMGSESTAWLYQHYRGREIPVISVCSKDPVELRQIKDYDSSSGTNFAFTSLNTPIEVQMAYIRELRPNLRNVAILVDGKNVSAMQTQAAPMAEAARRLNIKVLDVVVQNPANARAELKTLVADAVRAMKRSDPGLTNSVFWVTGSTSVFTEIDVINAEADRVPVISAVPEVVRPGDDSAALSIGVSFESNGHLAAIYAAEVLQGRAKAGDLKVGIVSPPDIAINFRKARDIGLAVPFSFFENAAYVYDYDGRMVRGNARTPDGGG